MANNGEIEHQLNFEVEDSMKNIFATGKSSNKNTLENHEKSHGLGNYLKNIKYYEESRMNNLADTSHRDTSNNNNNNNKNLFETSLQATKKLLVIPATQNTQIQMNPSPQSHKFKNSFTNDKLKNIESGFENFSSAPENEKSRVLPNFVTSEKKENFEQNYYMRDNIRDKADEDKDREGMMLSTYTKWTKERVKQLLPPKNSDSTKKIEFIVGSNNTKKFQKRGRGGKKSRVEDKEKSSFGGRGSYSKKNRAMNISPDSFNSSGMMQSKGIMDSSSFYAQFRSGNGMKKPRISKNSNSGFVKKKAKRITKPLRKKKSSASVATLPYKMKKSMKKKGKRKRKKSAYSAIDAKQLGIRERMPSGSPGMGRISKNDYEKIYRDEQPFASIPPKQELPPQFFNSKAKVVPRAGISSKSRNFFDEPAKPIYPLIEAEDSKNIAEESFESKKKRWEETLQSFEERKNSRKSLLSDSKSLTSKITNPNAPETQQQERDLALNNDYYIMKNPTFTNLNKGNEVARQEKTYYELQMSKRKLNSRPQSGEKPPTRPRNSSSSHFFNINPGQSGDYVLTKRSGGGNFMNMESDYLEAVDPSAQKEKNGYYSMRHEYRSKMSQQKRFHKTIESHKKALSQTGHGRVSSATSKPSRGHSSIKRKPSRDYNRVGERLYSQALLKKKFFDSQKLKLERKRKQEEMSECTFRPKINKKSKSVALSCTNVHNYRPNLPHSKKYIESQSDLLSKFNSSISFVSPKMVINLKKSEIQKEIDRIGKNSTSRLKGNIKANKTMNKSRSKKDSLNVIKSARMMKKKPIKADIRALK